MKKNKQIVTNGNLSFNNIKEADELINKKKNFLVNSKVVYLFRIDRDFHQIFNFLKNERAIRTKNYSEFNSGIFIIMINIVAQILKEKGIYKEANPIFIQTVNKRGKRKRNSRTVVKDRVEELLIYLSNEQSKVFLNCFFSHVSESRNEDVNDPSFSKNYFFNDIMNYISDNKDLFFKYKID
ncbi:hypothetical protein [Tenacibaculum finnmarkense]|uniref:hypothetical protein n=1 Tax=Tenacibaculum finnmarkense TaxID=2781243 RepID=UPI001EFB02D7|nr:hypothetical protein [Tenacibaculum finnmarkense]MCG8208164.1 hypothetical protein [Tenacibaculum finnmarkense genomovar finnmarkense]MCG8724162.1 hypothetical protein [Tenacibaculum finnmarkense]MCG8765875.1 hypothetical protein [Tenacibaculum finnmarkense]MCG8778813.1 hypothetical protein [Tenacibaculum finnmarkense]MCM8907291.1 hypothetical protein [Tenacibaculum finnmarkense genomovar finnmarkense]